MARRWYQTIDIDGEYQEFEDTKRAQSKFWNEGKWGTFVEPLLPDERRTFLEIGCNAGLFLKMAKDAGFERITGVECNGQIFRQAQVYRHYVDGDWKLEHQCVRADFDPEQFPLSDVVLISNTHYYMPVHVFSRLVDVLRNRCLYCIIVSAKAKRRQGNAAWDWNHVHGYFADWEKINSIAGISAGDDPTPRDTMFSVLFKGNLTALDVDSIYDPWMEASQSEKHKSHELAPSMEDFFQQVLNGNNFDYKDTDYYAYWRKRESKRSEEWAIDYLARKANLALDVQRNGMNTPVYYGRKNKTLDGIHRISIAKQLGHKYVLARII